MLLKQANSPLRFKDKCGFCHGEVAEFVKKQSGLEAMKSQGWKAARIWESFCPATTNYSQKTSTFF
jgi:hypothetical protein